MKRQVNLQSAICVGKLKAESGALKRSVQRSAITGRFYLLPFTFCLLLVLASCGGGRAGYVTQQQTVDGVTFTLEQPQQLAVLQNYELFVTLKDASGKPIDGATVFLEQDMPGMQMGSNQPLGEPSGSGQYTIKGVFSMDGAWRIVVHATIAGKEYAANFDQKVTPVQ